MNHLKEIIKIIMFIKDIDMKEIANNVSFSYTSIRNFLTYNSKMKIVHIIEIFDYLNFDFAVAIQLKEELKEEKYNRIGLFKRILEELERE